MLLWRNYFDKLLSNKENIDVIDLNILEAEEDLLIDCSDFTINEVKTVLKSLKNNKMCGIDYVIKNEALKYSGNISITMLCNLCNKVLKDGNPPSEWKTNIIIPIPKKGNLSSMDNYRGISLMSVSAKVYNRLMLNRIYHEVNKILRSSQTGFRKNMSSIEHICTLRRIMEGYKDKQLPLFVTFVDFSKAFDSIDREAIWKILRHYGIPLKMVNGIKSLYSQSKSIISIGKLKSDPFETTTGVLHQKKEIL